MILFNGYYGKLNTGDDAFVEVSGWGATNIWKKDRYRFLTVNGRLPQTVCRSRGYSISLPKTYRLQTYALLKRATHFISAGGSTFHSKLSPKHIRHIGLSAKKKWNKNLKIGAIGVSLGPFRDKEDEKAVISYLKEMDFLSLRDRKSYEFAKNISLPYEPVEAFDLAALLPDIYGRVSEKEPQRKAPIIGVSLCRYEEYLSDGDIRNEKRRLEKIELLIKELNKLHEIRFRFFIFNGHPTVGDHEITSRIIQKTMINNYEIVNYTPCTKDMFSSIQDCDFVLSVRLHAAIFACFANVPFMLVEYHRKCTDFLEDIGQDSEYILNDADFDLKSISHTIVNIISSRSFNAPNHIETMRNLAYRNFTDIEL